MSDVLLNTGGKNYKRVAYSQIASSTVLSLGLGGVTSAVASYSTAAGSSTPLSGDMEQLHLRTNLANSFTLSGVTFEAGNKRYVVRANGDVVTDIGATTGVGTKVGDLTLGVGELTLDLWPSGTSPLVSKWRGAAAAPVNGADSPYNTYAVTFRLPTAPIRTGSFSLLGTMRDGTTFNVTANNDGIINSTRVKGKINYTTGVVRVVFVTPDAPEGAIQTDISFLGVPGVSMVYVDLAKNDTLRFNAVAYSYLPVDADLLGIDPVRLPSDGRVPIFRRAGVAVLGSKQVTASETVVNGDTIDTGRTRLSRIRVLGHNNLVISTGWVVDLESGIVTFEDVTGYSQPVRIEHRVEDMALVSDAQIDGTISFTRALTHDYDPADSYVSSAFMTGDLHARVSLVFDQASWSPQVYLDAVTGEPATATFDTINHPIVVTNAGALTERWVIRFTSATAFQIIGEHVGIIGTGSTSVDAAPNNPATSAPYLTIPHEGWGSGWSAGNILRINTVGADEPVWMVRTVQQGPEAGEDYSFTVLVRGDVDNPL